MTTEAAATELDAVERSVAIWHDASLAMHRAAAQHGADDIDPEQALERAREADATSARGEPTGPLHGVPVTVKVNVDLDGTPNDNGLPALANNIAPGNSPVVQHLLDDPRTEHRFVRKKNEAIDKKLKKDGQRLEEGES